MKKVNYILFIGLQLILSTTMLNAQLLAEGESIVTCGTRNGSDYVVGKIDIRNRSSAPLGTNWLASMYHHPDWTRNRLGHVFGIALTNSGAIFVSATNVYLQQALGSLGAGGIYKLDQATGAVEDFKSLSLTSGTLGNMCYDVTNDQLFVSGSVDKKIFRLDPNDGTLLSTYTSTSGSGLLFGIGIFEERLYYAVDKTIYSLAILNDGSLGTTPIQELVLVSGSGAISDIAFSENGFMLVAQRGGPHTNFAYKFTRSGQSWGSQETVYIGNFRTGRNSAGGVDFGYASFDPAGAGGALDEMMWLTGNAIMWPGENPDGSSDRIYGMVGVPITGNSDTPGAPDYRKTRNYYVDFDANVLNNSKGYIGDVEVYRPVCSTGLTEIQVVWPYEDDRLNAPDLQDDRFLVCEVRIRKTD
ncbi:MAG: hypothetical protein AAGI07_03620, partial [Bacteroidota bacterium]